MVNPYDRNAFLIELSRNSGFDLFRGSRYGFILVDTFDNRTAAECAMREAKPGAEALPLVA